ncbi:MAG: ABC transporter permease [Alphaproteobacteria bacterium]
MTNINWIGFKTLYLREYRRFMSVASQTIAAPVVTTLLFLAVFMLAIGVNRVDINNVPFAQFLAPGLIMMTMVQNAFANTSSSLMIAKMQKNIVDTLMAPLSPFELTLGYMLGGVSRGILVGFSVFVVMLLLGFIVIHHPLIVLLYAFLACSMLSLLGTIGGIIAIKYDHLGAFTNFVITPLSFLSGTFYSVNALPKFGKILASYNPFFYMIDGFRYGFIGVSDGNIIHGFSVLFVSNVILFLIVYEMFRRGYRLKS